VTPGDASPARNATTPAIIARSFRLSYVIPSSVDKPFILSYVSPGYSGLKWRPTYLCERGVLREGLHDHAVERQCALEGPVPLVHARHLHQQRRQRAADKMRLVMMVVVAWP
jgi:hypothetical protein